MDLNDEDIGLVNIYDYYRAHGLSDQTAISIVLHLLLTKSYSTESDARAAAQEFNISIPYVLPDSGQLH